jgi:PAS domain S-box-containing protein
MITSDEFGRQIAGAQKRVRRLEQRAGANGAPEEKLFQAAMEELQTTLEELQVSEVELHQQAEELVEAQARVEAERRRYQELFEFAPDGYLVTDPEGMIREANYAAASLLGVEARFLAGKPLVNFLPAEERRAFRTEILRLQRATLLQVWGVRVQPRGGAPFHAALTGGAVRDTTGRLQGLRWLIRDISDHQRAMEQIRSLNDTLEQRVQERTAQLEAALQSRRQLLARERNARAEAEEAQRRLVFLAGASSLLSSSLECPEALTRLAELVVPYLADWCALDLVEGDGILRRVAVAPDDPAGAALPRELALVPESGASWGPAHVVSTGEAEIYAVDEEDAMEGERALLLEQWDIQGYLCVPLPGRGRSLGAITLLDTTAGRRFSPIDSAVAEDLARRAAAAVENARLYQAAVAASQVSYPSLAELSARLLDSLDAILTQVEQLRRTIGPPQVRQAATAIERQVHRQAKVLAELGGGGAAVQAEEAGWEESEKAEEVRG